MPLNILHYTMISQITPNKSCQGCQHQNYSCRNRDSLVENKTTRVITKTRYTAQKQPSRSKVGDVHSKSWKLPARRRGYENKRAKSLVHWR
eukprot:3237621-Amphidinium_carterae.1